ncbi:hypothetical protein PGTUg99_012807 [Puccinia graminis f. sp. tritici]|uniref:Uncharacterized protein n=1 Tax=Puccinia graminis f. sp. tritici TaxID=56615 RepID=A0A5B0Q898_PUCGR|nr:hypothetical protein PGTUg99_012807 [Puccinia graminis f. sp. tritici]
MGGKGDVFAHDSSQMLQTKGLNSGQDRGLHVQTQNGQRTKAQTLPEESPHLSDWVPSTKSQLQGGYITLPEYRAISIRVLHSEPKRVESFLEQFRATKVIEDAKNDGQIFKSSDIIRDHINWSMKNDKQNSYVRHWETGKFSIKQLTEKFQGNFNTLHFSDYVELLAHNPEYHNEMEKFRSFVLEGGGFNYQDFTGSSWDYNSVKEMFQQWKILKSPNWKDSPETKGKLISFDEFKRRLKNSFEFEEEMMNMIDRDPSLNKKYINFYSPSARKDLLWLPNLISYTFYWLNKNDNMPASILEKIQSGKTLKEISKEVELRFNQMELHMGKDTRSQGPTGTKIITHSGLVQETDTSLLRWIPSSKSELDNGYMKLREYSAIIRRSLEIPRGKMTEFVDHFKEIRGIQGTENEKGLSFKISDIIHEHLTWSLKNDPEHALVGSILGGESSIDEFVKIYELKVKNIKVQDITELLTDDHPYYKHNKEDFTQFLLEGGGNDVVDFSGASWDYRDVQKTYEDWKKFCRSDWREPQDTDKKFMSWKQFEQHSARLFGLDDKLIQDMKNSEYLQIKKSESLSQYAQEEKYWLPHMISLRLEWLNEENKMPPLIVEKMNSGMSLKGIAKELEQEFQDIKKSSSDIPVSAATSEKVSLKPTGMKNPPVSNKEQEISPPRKLSFISRWLKKITQATKTAWKKLMSIFKGTSK